MSEYEHRYARHPDTSSRAGAGIAPGKRSLTQSLPPAQRSLRDQQREVVDFDSAAGDDIYDPRATVDAKPTNVPLTDAQIRKASRKNPRWVEVLKVSAQIFSSAAANTPAFALDVADKQVSHGLQVDGIAGPKTVGAVAGRVSADRSAPPRTNPSSAGRDEPREVVDFDTAAGDAFYDTRATVDHDADPSQRFAQDDPFGMHLIGRT